MNSSESSFYPSSDGNLYNGSAGPNSHADRSINDTDEEPFIKGYIIYVSIIASIEIPIICLAVYAVYFLIKSNHSTPIFVINLLISDLIQIVCMLLFTIPLQWLTIMLTKTMFWAVFTGLYFMTCIAVERYVMIAHPAWHRSHRSVKSLVCTSLTGWIVSFIVFPIIHIEIEIFFFIPFIFYAVIILCFVGTCRSLSHSKTLTPLKKQLVLAPLLFVVISYTFLILPVNILAIVYNKWDKSIGSLIDFTVVLYLLNPLVDCLLYVLMRSDAENIIRTPHCCFRLKRVQSETRHVISTDVQDDHV